MTHGPNIFHEKFLNVLTKMKIQFMEICRSRWKHDLEGNITLNSYILLFSRSVISNSLRPHWLQHSRLPCPSPSPRACSNSRPSSRWCHPNISTSVIPFFSRLQSFPASGSFLISRLFASSGQSIRASVSASILPVNIQDGFPLQLTDLLAVQGVLKSLLQHHSSKASILQCSAFFMVQLSHPYMTTGKTIGLTRQALVGQVMSLLFKMLSRLVIAFL